MFQMFQGSSYLKPLPFVSAGTHVPVRQQLWVSVWKIKVAEAQTQTVPSTEPASVQAAGLHKVSFVLEVPQGPVLEVAPAQG